MQILQGLGQVRHHGTGLGLSEADPLLDVVEERAAAHLLEDQTEPGVLLEVLNKLNDVRLAFTQVEDLDLLEHLGPVEESRSLLDDLDSVLQLCVDVGAGKDPAVAALPQHLPGQTVEVTEAGGHQSSLRLLLPPPPDLGLLLSHLKGSSALHFYHIGLVSSQVHGSLTGSGHADHRTLNRSRQRPRC